MNNTNRILQWNCRGYRSRYEDICNILSSLQPSIVLLQETMLNESPSRPPKGYNIYTEFNSPTPGKGLAILIRRDTPHMKISIQTNLQAMAYRVGLDRQYTICNIYSSPSDTLHLNDLTALIDQLLPPIIICGDFNSRHPMWDRICALQDARSRVIETESTLLSTSLVVLKSGIATHFHTQTATSSAIDLSLCTADVSTEMSWRTLDDLYGSDHYPVVIEVSNENPYAAEPRYMEHRANWTRFNRETSIRNSEDLLSHHNCDELVDIFTELIIKAADIAIPKSSCILRPTKVPWWSAECQIAVDQRRDAYKKYNRSKLIIDKINYCKMRAMAKRVQAEAKRSSWQRFVNSLNVNTPMSKIWKRIRKIRGKYSNYSAPCLLKDGQHITDEAELAEIMASHYEKISSNESYSTKFQRIRRRNESVLDFRSVDEEDYNCPITTLELRRNLSLCANTAAGEDKITYNMIRNSHETAVDFLLAIMNKIYLTGEYPRRWQSAIVLSFPKPGKPSTIEENYRPISLTSCVSKLMEKIINTRLSIVLENSKLIPDNQFGFRRMHSTTDALNKLTTDVNNSLDNKQHVLCVSFDMKKAYDTTWRYGILKAIHNFGMRGSLPVFVQNYLTSRMFRTKIGNALSDYHTLDQGVPQGGVLSCTLFSLAINGVLGCIPGNVESILYVDDLLIYCSGNYVPVLERRLQTTINKIQEWTESHGFTFSPSKTNCIHFHRKRKFQTPLKLTLNNIIIPNRETIKYLGMEVDFKLTWKNHIKTLKIDCMKRLDILKCVSHTNWGSDSTTMLRLYRSIIRSKLDYGSFIYSSASVSTLKLLDPVHNAAIRLCTGAYRSSPALSLFCESGEYPLDMRRSQLLMQYHSRSLQAPSTIAFSYVQQGIILNPNTRSTTASRIMDTCEKLNLNIAAMPFSFGEVPTWQLLPNSKCDTYAYPKKDTCSDQTMRSYFNEHIEQYHGHETHIYTDGSKSEDGVGCSAVSITGSKKMRLMTESSIFTAELCGILSGIQIANTTHGGSLVIFCDSRSALQVVDHYDSTHPLIRKIVVWLIKLQKKGKYIKFCWCPAHVGIAGNERADQIATNIARSDSIISNDETPYRDWYPVIRHRIKEQWTDQWLQVEANKLRKLKETVVQWKSSQVDNRKHSIILTRLRIGHTKITHQFLMEQGPVPYCEDCIVPLTVKHLLAECPSNSETRIRYYPTCANLDTDATLALVLREKPDESYDLHRLLSYLRDIGVMDEII